MTATDADFRFVYHPVCDLPGCDQPPVCKVAAVWSDGLHSERKNYGLACVDHRDLLLARARERRQGLAVSDDEQVGPVEIIPLDARHRPAAPTP